MGKINLLKPNVFNMLAAGEVVERPASVVKELVENSLDAGATQIDIEVEEGGIRKIQVSDNGTGILKEDIRNAFLPHATSKIANIDDLDSLSTLGFRGEALASIASVSEVTLSSASKTQGTASKIALSGGTVTFEGEASRGTGTIICVENLFFNTPARLKFLKKPASEMRSILDTVRMLVLANPSIAFTLSNEEGVLLSHEGGSLSDVICAVYGVKTADKLIEVGGGGVGEYKVRGFVSAVDFTKSNRTYQTIIVNGRAVQDATIQTAVEKAYGDYLMKRAYPMFVIDLIMPFDEVDANVHPSKTEVRFLDKQKVFSAVYRAVKETVDRSVGNATFGFNVSSNNIISNNTPNTPNAANRVNLQAVLDIKNDKSSFPVEPKKPVHTVTEQAKFDTALLYYGMPYPFGQSHGVLKESAISGLFTGFGNSKPTNIDNDSAVLNEITQISSGNAADNESLGVFDGTIIGQIFATYLLVERDEMLYIIDQHAAHERILYDRIVQKFNSEYSQSLIVPYRLSLTGSEEEYLEKVLPTLTSLGFEITHSGYVYLVKAVPEPVSKMNFSKFFGELFSNMLSEKELTLAELMRDKLCQQACKAAIKGGETLTREQVQRVIKTYVGENGDLPSKCPHGRPAVIALNKRDFEKMFKRIV